MHSSEPAWLRVSQTAAWRYGIALLAFLVSFFVRDLLNDWLIGISDRGLIIFLPAILLVTFFLGLAPAILIVLLSALAVWYFFLPPYYSLAVGINGAIVLSTFIVSTGVGIALVHWLRITITAAEALATAHKQAEALVAADLRDMMLLNQLNNRLVRAGDDLDRNLEAVLDTAIAIAGAFKGSLRLLDPTRGVLILAAQRGFGEPYLNLFAAMPVEASTYAAAMKSGERVIIEDMRESVLLAGQRSGDVLLDAGVRAVTSTPLLASTGNLLGMVSTHFAEPHRPSERELHLMDLLARQVADYLERKRADEKEATLSREIQHRSNNLLSVIQTIAKRSLSGRQTLAKARKAFEARLQALARSNRELTKSNWSGVSLREIVRLELQPYSARTKINGSDVMLNPQHAQNFSMTMHELATNAAKYGALSNGSGTVGVSWRIGKGPSNSNNLTFKWRESGGPPVVAPTRQGFGTTLIKATFPDARMDYGVAGLRCEIDIPLGENQRDQTGLA